MRVEVKGMLGTALIGNELRKGGQEIPVTNFHTGTLVDYQRYLEANPHGTFREFLIIHADKVLDIKHSQGSHREVYTNQFRNFKRTENKQHILAGKIEDMSKILGDDKAIEKLLKEELHQVSALFDYLTKKRDELFYPNLRIVILRGLAPFLTAEINNGDTKFILSNPELMAALHNWLEANDDGTYSELSKVLGLSLGYYDNHPEHLGSEYSTVVLRAVANMQAAGKLTSSKIARLHSKKLSE